MRGRGRRTGAGRPSERAGLRGVVLIDSRKHRNFACVVGRLLASDQALITADASLLLPMTLLPRLSILLSLATCTHALRFLALHGGTDNPTTFQGQMGDVVNALGSSHTWVYAQGAYPNPVAGTAGEYLWIRDAPGGKNAGTTDPNWAQASFTSLDNYVATQGPFDAIVGYSQGAAMTLLYLSQSASSFRFALTFCGYLPTVHSGLTGLVTAAAPISIPTLFYYGTADTIISNGMTTSAASYFSAATMVSDGGGHDPPTSGPALK